MIVGFTGTRKGMTDRQRAVVALALCGATEAHHGDCIGADAEFHELALAADIPVVLHPPTDPKFRAFCEGAALQLRPQPYLVRNKNIVESCDVLLAAPSEATEPGPSRGQGTWSTVRYARRKGVQERVLWP